MARPSSTFFPSTAHIRIEKWGKAFILYSGLLIGVGIMIMPFVWMVLTSIKPRGEILSYPPSFAVHHPTFDSFRDLFRLVPMKRYILNSVIVAGAVTISNLFFCSMAGYAFAKHKFWGRDKIFLLLLGSMMVPWQVNIVPAFVLIKKLGWLSTYQGLIIPTMAGAFGIFLMRQFIREIPNDLLDSARIDGCSEFYIYWRIVLPLCRPALASLSIFMFMQQWNNFVWPLIIIHDSKMRTVPLILAVLNGQFGGSFGLLMAGAVISILPMMIMFLLFQKQIIKGIVLEGIKE
ncbi:MAG: carbohydrate ABC transporter permease [Elusimicrobia bacterium]|nr:carbohydrate ABC transporter permease [Elusimicrobiota bacterium]